MKILGILLVLMGIFKFSMVGKADKDSIADRATDLPISADTLYEIVKGVLLLDGLLEVTCGAFIIFL